MIEIAKTGYERELKSSLPMPDYDLIVIPASAGNQRENGFDLRTSGFPPSRE
jgi:hypothetical protein